MSLNQVNSDDATLARDHRIISESNNHVSNARLLHKELGNDPKSSNIARKSRLFLRF